MTSLICSVRPENFTEEVMAEKRLVLLIFMLPDDTDPGQLKIAEVNRLYGVYRPQNDYAFYRTAFESISMICEGTGFLTI